MIPVVKCGSKTHSSNDVETNYTTWLSLFTVITHVKSICDVVVDLSHHVFFMLLFWSILILVFLCLIHLSVSVFILTMRLRKKQQTAETEKSILCGPFMALQVSAELPNRLNTKLRILGPCLLWHSFAIARVITISATVRSLRPWSLEGLKTSLGCR